MRRAWYKKRKLMVLSILLCMMLVGTSYALWQITLRQTNENLLTGQSFSYNSGFNGVYGDGGSLTSSRGKIL